VIRPRVRRASDVIAWLAVFFSTGVEMGTLPKMLLVVVSRSWRGPEVGRGKEGMEER
jgi:hypothetical protein